MKPKCLNRKGKLCNVFPLQEAHRFSTVVLHSVAANLMAHDEGTKIVFFFEMLDF